MKSGYRRKTAELQSVPVQLMEYLIAILFGFNRRQTIIYQCQSIHVCSCRGRDLFRLVVHHSRAGSHPVLFDHCSGERLLRGHKHLQVNWPCPHRKARRTQQVRRNQLSLVLNNVTQSAGGCFVSDNWMCILRIERPVPARQSKKNRPPNIASLLFHFRHP